MSLTITILGCGSSGGVPRVGQGWGHCNPDDPRNRRRRCSILLQQHGDRLGDRLPGAPPAEATTVVVDTSPDLREQFLAADVQRLDGILMTHSHADHTHGIDDVRPLVIKMRRRIDMHMDEPTSQVVRNNFSYIFESPPGSQYPPLLNERRLIHGQPARIDGPGGPLEAWPFLLDHGEIEALGFRFGDVAYTPDLIKVPDDSLAFLEGLDLWIIDALRYTRHPSHLSVEEALELIARMKPRRAILTNLHTDLDYATLRAQLPASVEPAYDGMVLTA